ncbi:hypothetical protein J6590_014402 [Homalodisca vitripennis]|nr:hypothetical protein J6590_014402 [Homalodisca vitripennis]
MEVGEQKEADKVLKSPETVDELPPSEMGTKEKSTCHHTIGALAKSRELSCRANQLCDLCSNWQRVGERSCVAWGEA